jgi:hypothetical protein
MKNNTSPGSDRYTVEFFKFFWKDIGISQKEIKIKVF